MNTNNQAQTEKAPPALKPSFHHRLCYSNLSDCAEATPEGLSLTVEMIATRADAVLSMIQGEFSGEEAEQATIFFITHLS